MIFYTQNDILLTMLISTRGAREATILSSSRMNFSSTLRGIKTKDPDCAYVTPVRSYRPDEFIIKIGVVVQYNIGLYSALVSCDDSIYVCSVGNLNVTTGFGYSDITLIRDGDRVFFAADTTPGSKNGVILGKKPVLTSVDDVHHVKKQSDTELERRTHFFSSECYRKKSKAYSVTLDNKDDMSMRRYMNNRPTDMLPGEFGTMNQHHCGFTGSLFSATMHGGGAHIRMFALENKIRIVAENIAKYTFTGNENSWHNRRYLSNERLVCMYQEERLGVFAKKVPAYESYDPDRYHNEGYFTKNLEKKQTARPRILEQEGYYAGLYARYCMRPDLEPQDGAQARRFGDKAKDFGVSRESIDPSGQYRLAATGMISSERIGRIPVPVRIEHPWKKEASEPTASSLTPFKHDEQNPYYRQLELADRVAYDLKNSYARVDEGKDEFYVPEETDLEDQISDKYDPTFTKSETVKLAKYDRRRSGIYQGEDGSVIIRDAWGSEIVMIGGNIQLSCAGNIEVLPGKSSLTIAGDDIVQKAQNSVDIEASEHDVRMSAYRNVQVVGGADEEHGGGILLEAKGTAGPYDSEAKDGGESIGTRGIVLKSKDGSVVTEAKNTVIRSYDNISIVGGEEEPDGTILISARDILTYGTNIISTTDRAACIVTSSGLLVGDGAILAGNSAAVFSGTESMVPLMWADAGANIKSVIMDALSDLREYLKDEKKVSLGYSYGKLEKMHFKFRSSQECGATSSWELQGKKFSLYEPYWIQVSTKFETVSVDTKEYDDHPDDWEETMGKPWPGTEARSSGVYVKLANLAPVNMGKDGFNVKRSEVQDSTSVVEVPLFPGYLVRN